jgi:hypothetical protein
LSGVPCMHDRPLFTREAIGRIEAMLDSGSTNKEIATAIGTTEGCLAVRLSQLGLSRSSRRHMDNRTRVTFPEGIVTRCAPYAAQRALAPAGLIMLLIDRIVQDNLFEAVLDDGDS